MNERTMLEMAAKAAGHEVARVADDGYGLMLVGVQYAWTPLHNAADRWNLAEACKLEIDFGIARVFAWLPESGSLLEYSVTTEGQSLAWCTVRAAAAIGEAMP